MLPAIVELPSLRLRSVNSETGAWVSTVDLMGIKHIGGYYETYYVAMDIDDVVERYETLEEAIKGHARWVGRTGRYGKWKHAFLLFTSWRGW